MVRVNFPHIKNCSHVTLFPITSTLSLLTPAEKIDFLSDFHFRAITHMICLLSPASSCSVPSFKLCLFHLIHGVIYRLKQCKSKKSFLEFFCFTLSIYAMYNSCIFAYVYLILSLAEIPNFDSQSTY